MPNNGIASLCETPISHGAATRNYLLSLYGFLSGLQTLHGLKPDSIAVDWRLNSSPRRRIFAPYSQSHRW